MCLSIITLMLLVVHDSLASLYCEFDQNLCDWKETTLCNWKLINNQSIDGDRGYLLADAELCQPSKISLNVLNDKGPFKMKLKYFLEGDDPAMLSVGTEYTLSDDRLLWSTNNTEMSNWNYHELQIERGTYDVLEAITINANVMGSSKVLLGSITTIEDPGTTLEFATSTHKLTLSTEKFDDVNQHTRVNDYDKMPRASFYIIGALSLLAIIVVLCVSVYSLVY